MSVWKQIKSEVLKKNVNKKMLESTLKSMGIGLDYSVKNIKNAYGTDTCDAALVKNNKVTSMGIRFNKQKGIELVGDIWGTGLGKHLGQEDLMNEIAHNYQVNNVKKQLMYSNWNIENEVTKNGKTVIELVQY